MRLTRFTDLALRVLMLLAAQPEGERCTTRGIAEAVNAPYAHVAKAVSRLQHLGLVGTRRGRGGGLALTSQGRDASVGHAVRALEGDGEVVDCDGTDPCPLRPACRLRGELRRAQEAFYAALDPVTVRDLVAEPAGRVLLGLPGRG
ncbi:Rrf2 family transcriptional regulator [Streptomyces sp. 7-21]|uniref:RrF2 family transcriptional regulator n=1 Tax=Streptomyces sp. 7-21 TaxID=2802283 RepID=UPI00191DF043|nr:Rrf2 family transcriptional regulator [Streptomyces sp. 7-21]MBL1068924.1 Rrf2 family transcriptional regulator [Streptomyces sp. 7-21]